MSPAATPSTSPSAAPAEPPAPAGADDEAAGPMAVMVMALVASLLLVGLYYAGASRYFADKFADPLWRDSLGASSASAAVMNRLPWFTLFAVLISLGSALAVLMPRALGLGAVVLFAAGLLLAGAYGVGVLPSLLVLTHLVFGALFAIFGWLLFARGNRAAWAGLVAMSGVLAGVELFASAKIAKVLSISLWAALAPCALFIVGTVALRGCAPRERAATARR